MNSSTIIGLINNVALLLALGLIYDMVGSRPLGEKPSLQQVITGIALGAIGIAVMLTPWELSPGLFFDTRSVLLSISGLFFGTIPTLIVVIITSAFRLYSGGTGAWAGVGLIFTAGAIGVAWRHFRKRDQGNISVKELYLLGVVVHIFMLLWMLTLPWPLPLRVIPQVGVPVMIIFPAGTALLGQLMLNRQRRKRIEKKLQESESRYRTLFERSSDAIFLVDTDTGHYLDANRAAERLTGQSISELKKMTTHDVTPVEAQKRLRLASTAKETQEMGEVSYVKPDGSIRIAVVSAVPLDKQTIFGLAHDITERAQAEKELKTANVQLETQLAEIKELEMALRDQALRDPLTGLFNRRYMEEALKQNLAQAIREKKTLSVVMLDLDSLKEINDVYGHVAGGDKALRAIAECVQPLCRGGDTFCRYAGDEFIIILYDTSQGAALKRTLEWKEAVAKIKIKSGSNEFGVTFSAGVAEYSKSAHGTAENKLIQQADEALYQAKELGRDRVVAYSEAK